VSADRPGWSVYSSPDAIAQNPYVLAEEYSGDGVDDFISFSKIDHGMIPSPDLGGTRLAEKDDWRRLRSLCVERLRRETRSTFIRSDRMIAQINDRLKPLPEWKRQDFTERYLEVDAAHLEAALVLRGSRNLSMTHEGGLFHATSPIEARTGRASSSTTESQDPAD
jgi:hypothetical protein